MQRQDPAGCLSQDIRMEDGQDQVKEVNDKKSQFTQNFFYPCLADNVKLYYPSE